MVKWTTPAKFDLKDIHDYIARDSKYYAQKVSQDIVDKSERLKYFPEIGRIVPEINEPNIRELFIYSYRLIYEVLPNGVQVLALIHGKQNFTGNLNEPRKQKERY
ncbi:MAG: type II toxin-antitoxin system RelE/ParE family toxin [Nitrospinae bacterium]|nr:type II toxin-antitoxin system RelE/ParE family toxin [Nitrospinota bacterium]